MCGVRPGIGNRLDGAEKIFPRGAREETSEALEMLVAFFLVARAGMKISAVVVALPDFDHRIFYRTPAAVQDAPAEPGHFAHGGRDVVIENEKIVIGIEREFIRIKWTLGLFGGEIQVFRKGATNREIGCGEAEPFKKISPRWKQKR